VTTLCKDNLIPIIFPSHAKTFGMGFPLFGIRDGIFPFPYIEKLPSRSSPGFPWDGNPFKNMGNGKFSLHMMISRIYPIPRQDREGIIPSRSWTEWEIPIPKFSKNVVPILWEGNPVPISHGKIPSQRSA
jgi:hypothetical protein